MTRTSPNPEWRVISHAPNYAVSENGDVKRVRAAFRRPTVGNIIKPVPNERGYLTVCIYADGKRSTAVVHRLVCEAWHGPKPTAQHQAAHNDGDKLNNNQKNLRWATAKENDADKDLHGTRQSGERHPCRKLTTAKVRQIRSEYVGRRGQLNEIGDRFGVSRSTIHLIVKNKIWTGADA